LSQPGLPRLALGTVQFGLPYGPTRAVPLSREDAAAVLAAAWKGGIDMLDTGAAYGNAETVIGELRPAGARFAVISKTHPLRRSELGASEITQVVDAARRSVRLLGVPALEGLLVHHAPDLLAAGGDALFRALEGLRAEGLVRRLGVSVYDAATLKAVLERFPVQIVQLPLNLLDQRFLRDGTLAQLARSSVEIHARSVFLQGVLLANAAQLPPRFAGVRERIERFHAACLAAGVSRAAAALGFVAGCPGVSRVVIGVNTAAQLEDNLSAFSVATAASWELDTASYAVGDPEIIDPRRWAA
jgi:aryl-alcohol dehydrogenase-like predicted oxidoreductase